MNQRALWPILAVTSPTDVAGAAGGPTGVCGGALATVVSRAAADREYRPAKQPFVDTGSVVQSGTSRSHVATLK
jgi:hypothetical protein